MVDLLPQVARSSPISSCHSQIFVAVLDVMNKMGAFSFLRSLPFLRALGSVEPSLDVLSLGHVHQGSAKCDEFLTFVGTACIQEI
ncbi:hypothetical protein AMTR_s00012p00074430 [Amborella trichopoda]|uniref:Uncharacterized protein n=1 Tax=Amborella trichopoda TaxID=13333 RepID=W1PIC6_AMBTC|nr:hypothetical protein AMTR_s00012p00074430 [Amborella trichopoda]